MKRAIVAPEPRSDEGSGDVIGEDSGDAVVEDSGNAVVADSVDVVVEGSVDAAIESPDVEVVGVGAAIEATHRALGGQNTLGRRR